MRRSTVLFSAGCVVLLSGGLIWAGRNGMAKPASGPPPVSEIVEVKEGHIEAATSPITLTASDGSGIKLVALTARAAVEDPLAFTELHMVFENPEDRVREGTFRITLPQGASLSRFAMKVGSAWQEGEVVEKQAARRAYEDFLHRRQDPALLEQAAGNEFSARVFPIPAKGRKEIILSFSSELHANDNYTLPLKGLPMLQMLDVSVRAAGTSEATFAFKRGKFAPAEDFVVDRKKLPRNEALRSGDLAAFRVVPVTTDEPAPLGKAVVLFDTSASRALGLEASARMLGRVLAQSKDAEVAVFAFDQAAELVYEGKATGFGDAEVRKIVDRGALGASNLEGAFAAVGAWAKAGKAGRLVLVTDGVPTSGETDAAHLAPKLEALKGAGISRMDVIAAGGIRDDALMRRLTRGVLPKDGAVLASDLGPEEIAARLARTTVSSVPIKVDGASWSYPRTADGVQPGDEVLVYAEVAGPEGASPRGEIAGNTGRITIGDGAGARTIQVKSRLVERPLLERAWAQAKIQSLMDDKTGEDRKAEIVRLSTKHRVLSPYTALLVLETDADYARFGIDRTATVDILTVGDGRVAVAKRKRSGEMDSVDDDEKTANRPTTSATRAKAEEGVGPQGATGSPRVATATAAPTAAPPADLALPTTPPVEAITDIPMASASVASPPPPPPAGPMNEPTAGQERRIENNVGGDGLGMGMGLSGSGQGGGGVATGHARMARPAPARDPRSQALDQTGDFGLGLRGRGAPPLPEQGIPGVSIASVSATGGLGEAEAQRALRARLPAVRACYNRALQSDRQLTGAAALRLEVDATGEVTAASDTGSAMSDRSVLDCTTRELKAIRFPAPAKSATVNVRLAFRPTVGEGGTSGPARGAQPYEGKFADVMEAVSRGDGKAALDRAEAWRKKDPGDVLALVALGEAYETKGDKAQAARAYGSIVDLFSFRADSRRFAGERLERLKLPVAGSLAIDTFGKAEEQRPDHPASHRLYAFALLRAGQYEKAFEVARAGAKRTYPSGRFAGVEQILREDLGLIAAAWIRAEPARRKEIEERLRDAGGTQENGPSLRFVLNWETDANDVDFHIHDGRGGHAFYSSPALPSGGRLYADVTTGYGPECFTIRAAEGARAYPYTLEAHYYSRGPMGYGMGKLEVIDHDGQGKLVFDERPFVVMVNQAFVDLGTVERDFARR